MTTETAIVATVATVAQETTATTKAPKVLNGEQIQQINECFRTSKLGVKDDDPNKKYQVCLLVTRRTRHVPRSP